MLRNWGLKHNRPKAELGGDAIVFELVTDFNGCGSALTFPSIIDGSYSEGGNVFLAARFNNKTVVMQFLHIFILLTLLDFAFHFDL